MSYLLTVFETFFSMTNTILIPIPLTTNYVVNIPLFAIIYATIIFGILIYILSKLFDIETSFVSQTAHHLYGNVLGKSLKAHDVRVANETEREQYKDKKRK